MIELKGIVPPAVTPLRDDESVDEPALAGILDWLIEAGVHGLFFLGSTGEQPALRDAVRAQAIRCAASVVRGRVPLIVGAMASSTGRAIDNVRAAAECGADAVAVTPPHYYPSRGEGEQIAHYRAVADASPVPVIIYNIPSTTKVMLSPAVMALIAEDRRIAGLKDSSGEFIHFLQVLERCPPRPGFGVMVGSPPLAGAAVLYGGSGAVPGVANIDPQTMLGVYDAALKGDLLRLRALQARVHRLMSIVTHGAPIACIKAAMHLLGRCPARAAAPLQPVPPEAREAIAATLRELELL